MAGSSDTYHEPLDKLSSTTQDMHRALVSLQEELEAVDWYQQRADACEDAELKAILLHNMREEIEHASMVLEWLRRNHPDFATYLRTYLFQEKPILAVEGADQAANGKATPNTGRPQRMGLTVGTMKGD
ncbi:MAG TPA: ferritin-like domain-containing protein [Candidatus Tectomicrobia bacterium]|nr:ferritin-like domain-containing protein [Candidatus Tectomicrobia bacterium]